MIFELAANLIGLASGFVLASKQLLLRQVNHSSKKYGRVAKIIANQSTELEANPASKFKISVIVPLFNDLGYLPTLMTSLSAQSRPTDEIIIVGECAVHPSNVLHNGDNFRYIMTSSKSIEVSRQDKLHDDCLAGAIASTGDLLIFLPSEVRLERDAIELMFQEATRRSSVDRSIHFQAISVQPYCEVINFHDYASLFTMLASSFGKGLCHKKTSYLTDTLSPVVFVARDVFLASSSHETAEKVAVDKHDSILPLAKVSDTESPTFTSYLGGQHIRFRPGNGRFRSLMQFLVEDTAPGILRIPPRFLVLVALWLLACTSIVIELIQASFQTDAWPVLIYLALYLLTLVQLNLASRHVGRFSKSAIFFYPLWLATFWVIFIISFFRNYVFSKSKSNQEETTL